MDRTASVVSLNPRIELVAVRLGGGKTTSGYFYQLLHAVDVFDETAPPTVRVFGITGQLGAEQLIDRYRLACRPLRDLLVQYLRERQSAVDYVTLQHLATTPGKLFRADLERHHPGIDSLRLPADVATGWKHRILTVNRACRPSPRCARSTSTSPNGPWNTPPGGARGPHPDRSAPTTCPGKSRTGSANPAWTNAPANDSRCCPT